MKLWGGRFEKETDQAAYDFQSSLRIDKRMYKQDILGSIAHSKALNKCGILTDNETELIEVTLLDILKGLTEGTLEFDEESEDIHSNIEKLLTERLGSLGKKVHTGRSRNDQVALDFRLYLIGEVNETVDIIKELEQTLLKLSEQHLNTILPGFTHLQKAQPITLAHYYMSYFQMFKRDIERLVDAKKRLNANPLGSGALAGTTYDIDRDLTAELLGLGYVTENSLDAVSDRDFAIELTSALSITMMHLSRFCEEIIIWASQEYGYIELDDGYSTGSSIMPQKKNPDFAELIRGKTGRVYGSLITMLTIMKSLPLAYNKDMQEDKETVFDAFDTVKSCLTIFNSMIQTTAINKEKMYQSAQGGYANATDLADYLVKKGIPFRDAHEVCGRIVRYGIKNNLALSEIKLNDYKEFNELIEADIYEEISLEKCISSRNIKGGPAPSAVQKSIENGEEFLANMCKCDIKL